MKSFIVACLCISAILANPHSGITKKNPPNARIIGGEPARAGQFPYSAYIEINTATAHQTCGGVLLTNEWVLTAATCVDGGVLFRVQLGSTKREGSDSARVTLTADEYVLHPNYNNITLDFNLALIKFRLPITFTDYIKPVSFLPVNTLPTSAPGTIVGWGQTSDDVAGDAEELQYARVVALSNDECKLTYGNQITDTMVCVEGNFNEGTCIGDSGNPFVQIIGLDHAVLVGISSFHSQNGCESTDPSGFTRVFEAKQWIVETTGLQ